MEEFICPNCGGLNVDIHDEWFSDDGIRIWCMDCGYRKYEKCAEDLDTITTYKKKHKKIKRTRASRRFKTHIKKLRLRRISAFKKKTDKNLSL